MPDRGFIKTINNAYDVSSFYAITQGVHLFNNKKAFELYEATNSDVRREYFFSANEKFKRNMLLNLTVLQDHKEFLEYLKQ